MNEIAVNIEFTLKLCEWAQIEFRKSSNLILHDMNLNRRLNQFIDRNHMEWFSKMTFSLNAVRTGVCL